MTGTGSWFGVLVPSESFAGSCAHWLDKIENTEREGVMARIGRMVRQAP